MAEGSRKKRKPLTLEIRPQGTLRKHLPRSCPSPRLQCTAFPRWQRRPRGRARVTCWVSARSRRAQVRGRAEAAARARPDSRAPGGSVPSRGRTRLPARRPGPFPRGRLLANNGGLHRRHNAGGEPESSEAGSAAPPAREPSPYLPASTSRGTSGPGGGGNGHEAGRPVGVAARGEARRARPNCPGPPAGPALQPRPGRGWERGRRHQAAASGAMNRAFSQCAVQARPPRARVRGRGPARPEPAAVTQDRPRSRRSRPQRPPPTSPPARPPFRPAAARRLRPRPAPGLGRRGPSHCDTAAPGRACAAPSPRASASAPRHSPAFPWCRNGSGDVATWSLGPGPG